MKFAKIGKIVVVLCLGMNGYVLAQSDGGTCDLGFGEKFIVTPVGDALPVGTLDFGSFNVSLGEGLPRGGALEWDYADQFGTTFTYRYFGSRQRLDIYNLGKYLRSVSCK